MKNTVALSVALIGVALLGCHRIYESAGASGGTSGPPAATPVTVAPVEVRELTEAENYSARLEAAESVEIRPRVSGYLNEVKFEAGQLVKKGDILFVINPRPMETALKAAEADLTRAQVTAEITGKESARAERLLADKTLSSEEADSRVWRARDAAAALLGAEAAVQTARINLDYCYVKSPISGRIGRALVTSGNNVSGVDGFTTLLATVVSVDPIHVYAAMEEGALLKYRRLDREGKLERSSSGRVAVELQIADGQGFAYRGEIEHFDNRLDSNTGTMVVRSVFSNPDGRLVPGLYALVRIPTSAREKALLVSERAIGTEQSLKYVWTLTSSNTARKSFITLGDSLGGMRVVRSGLHATDRVVVNGIQRVMQPGMPLAPETESPAPPTAAVP